MCLVGCLSLFVPRIAIILLVLFAPSWLFGPIDPSWLVLPGWFFLPYTTLAYAFGVNTVAPVGEMGPLGWLIVVLAILADLGHLGGGAGYSARRVRHERARRR